MAGNPEQAAGIKSEANTATQANILAGGQAAGFQKANDILHDKVGDIIRILWYYRYTDPLGDFKTNGRFHDFVLNIKARSMSRQDPATRNRNMQTFAVQVLPSAVQAAQVAQQAGLQFNLPKFLGDIAEIWDLTDKVDTWLIDPNFAARTKFLLDRALAESQNPIQGVGSAKPAGTNSATQSKSATTGGKPQPTDQQGQRQTAQSGAVDSQKEIKQEAGFVNPL